MHAHESDRMRHADAGAKAVVLPAQAAQIGENGVGGAYDQRKRAWPAIEGVQKGSSQKRRG